MTQFRAGFNVGYMRGYRAAMDQSREWLSYTDKSLESAWPDPRKHYDAYVEALEQQVDGAEQPQSTKECSR